NKNVSEQQEVTKVITIPFPIIFRYTSFFPSPKSASIDKRSWMGEKPKNNLTAARLLAAYEVLARDSDLANPSLSQKERLRRARHLVRTYERLRKVNPSFRDEGAQLRAARSAINQFQYQRRKAKQIEQ